MPSYDFRCKDCGTRFTLNYTTVADYDAATPQCTNCASESLSRLITKVAIKAPTRDYTRMSSGEMLSVLDSGDSRQVGELFKQVGGEDSVAMGADMHHATERLLKGDKIEKVERDLAGGKS